MSQDPMPVLTPVWYPIQFHEDDRAQRLLNVFSMINGLQFNISYVPSTQHVVAWHRHRFQTDFWVCIKGALKVGLAVDGIEGFSKPQVRWEYISDKHFRVLEIKPGIYHGYKAVQPDSILLYYLDREYNPDDEFRKAVGAFNECWDTESK